MADRLYLSLWYPNFRLESLPSALTGVLRQFTLVGSKRISAASAYPIDFTESPTYQRIYVNSGPDPATHTPPEISPNTGESDGLLESAVAEATEQLHDDMAYEFEIRWHLWALEDPATSSISANAIPDDDNDDAPEDDVFQAPDTANPEDSTSPWRLRPHTVRILGFGPNFDVSGYEQNGHILVDFGLDTPWVLDAPLPSAAPTATTTPLTAETPTRNTAHITIAPPASAPIPLDKQAQLHIQQNIEKLLAFTLLVEKNCGISSRLLWTESGEPLAEKLIARLQRVN
ncbi:MAG TPA: hypothetical protein VGU46_00170 [Acidobacteriaceae bacterium]|nr:hypothetical protein [Acidobacteriaceae bacterium]